MSDFSGIYQIQSKRKPVRIYIGSAIYIGRRWLQHLERLRKGTHHSIKLQRHFNKYKENDLNFSVLTECMQKDLLSIEQYYLDKYKPYFNTALSAYSQLGLKHSEETKKKISLAKRGCDYWTGRKHNKESKQKMRLAHLGKKASLKTRRKLSKMRIGNQWAKGNKNRVGWTKQKGAEFIIEKIKKGVNKYYNNLK